MPRPRPAVPGSRRPARIGKYEIIHEVGQGTTGRVYLSHDPYYGRDVAIKLYQIDDSDERAARVTRKMFFNEAQMVGRLQHPNILPIYDAGESEGQLYVVTEYVHGPRTLAAYCRPDNLLPVENVIEIIFKCAKALSYAHSRGVIHRDIKPNNILLTVDNDVRIIDFGIALLRNSEVSRIQGIAGSPSYMSPEQVQSFELTPHSDLYSLGAVTYELLSGFRPFRADDLSRLLHQIVYASPAPLHTLREGVPEELEHIVMVALQKDPEKRQRNGLEMAAQLTRVHQDLRSRHDDIASSERFDVLRRLRFFHDFSHSEIRELMRAADWQEHDSGDEIVREGDMDDRFYILVSGAAEVRRLGRPVGRLGEGDCFGENGYVEGSKRNATVIADGSVILMSISATLLEQASTACQLRFNKMFLRALIQRLQSSARAELDAEPPLLTARS